MARSKAERPAGVEKNQSYATPALEKGLDVIELLAHQSSGLTKSELARMLNRTVSEIFRMLLCLERRGYIAQGPEERYSLTLKMFKLIQEHPPTERLIAEALPVMKQLAQDTGQSCHLGVLEAGQVVIVAQSNSPLNLGFYVKLGSTVDIMDSASGYVVLAHQDDELRAATLAAWRQATGRQPPPDFGRHLTRIRRAGFEKRASYLVKGVVNISFPIFDDRAAPLGALTLPYIQYSNLQRDVRQATEDLRAAAGRISAAIGGKARSGTA